MIEKTTYVAFDGTEFENKKECMKYENQLISEKKSIILWNIYGDKIIDLSPDIFDDICYDICFIYVGSEEDKKFLSDNLPFTIEWDNDNFYFLSSNEQDFISISRYQQKYIEERYETALELKESVGL